jgi:hypothetical protein
MKKASTVRLRIDKTRPAIIPPNIRFSRLTTVREFDAKINK